MLAAGAADAVALFAVVLVAVVLAEMVAPASLALALVLVHAVRLAEGFATSFAAALAILLQLRREGAIDVPTGMFCLPSLAAPLTALPVRGWHGEDGVMR